LSWKIPANLKPEGEEFFIPKSTGFRSLSWVSLWKKLLAFPFFSKSVSLHFESEKQWTPAAFEKLETFDAVPRERASEEPRSEFCSLAGCRASVTVFLKNSSPHSAV
jgi:hypothetical protein